MPNFEKLHEIALALQSKDRERRYWKTFQVEALMGWLLHEGRCVYCGVELVEIRRMMDCFGTTDHLLPRGGKNKYPELDFKKENIEAKDTKEDQLVHNAAPVCPGCNQIKGQWDPNREGGEPLYDRSKQLNMEIQRELIARAKHHIDSEREERRRPFQQQQADWLAALQEWREANVENE